MKTIQMSINWWTNKMLYIHMIGCYLTIKGRTDTSYDKDEYWKYTYWKKPNTNDCVLYDSIYMKFPEQANL